jgi:hypothetical protein
MVAFDLVVGLIAGIGDGSRWAVTLSCMDYAVGRKEQGRGLKGPPALLHYSPEDNPLNLLQKEHY